MVKRHVFSLSDALIECVQSFETPALMQKKQIETDIAEGIFLNGEEKTIRQLFDILLDNAVKYSTEDSSIRVHMYTKGNKTILTVWNETEPIPQGNLDQVFERFIGWMRRGIQKRRFRYRTVCGKSSGYRAQRKNFRIQ